MIGAIAPTGKDDDYFKELGQDNSIFFVVGSDLSSYTSTSGGALYLGFNDYALPGNTPATSDNTGSVTATVTESSCNLTQVAAFVTRFYQECLGRPPDPVGLNGWINYLCNAVSFYFFV